MRRKLAAAATAAVMATTMTLAASPAWAGEDDQSGWHVKAGDTWIPADELVPVGELGMEPPTESPEPSTQLISFDQWAECYLFNNEGYILKHYNQPWNGVVNDITLRCGSASGGYKHIEAQHKSQWEDRLNAVPGGASWGSWDDLMSVAIVSALDWSDWLEDRPGNKRCAYGTVAWYDSEGHITYIFQPTIVWSINNESIITAIPTSSGSRSNT